MSRPLNFQQILAFKAVMELGTTIRAAEYLNTTQPSISRRLSEIQSATELELFELHRGRLRPTSEAKLLYKTIQKHFDGLESIENVIAIMRRSGVGVLRLGSTSTLALGLLPPVTQEFLTLFPDVHIEVQTTTTQQLVDYLHQDLIDVAFSTGNLESDFEAERVHQSQAVCVMPSRHPLASRACIQPSDLLQDRLLSLSDNDDFTIRLRGIMRDLGIEPERTIAATSSITICALVAEGSGLGVVNPYVARSFAGRLAIRPFEPALDTSVYMATPNRSTPSLLARHYMDLLRKKAAQLTVPPSSADLHF